MLCLSRRWRTSWWKSYRRSTLDFAPGNRSAQDLARRRLHANGCSRTAAGGTVGGSPCPCPRGDLQAHGSYVAWWHRMAPDPFEGRHRQPGRYTNTGQGLVSYSFCSSSASTEWRKSVVAAVTTVTHSANCAVLGSAE